MQRLPPAALRPPPKGPQQEPSVKGRQTERKGRAPVGPRGRRHRSISNRSPAPRTSCPGRLTGPMLPALLVSDPNRPQNHCRRYIVKNLNHNNPVLNATWLPRYVSRWRLTREHCVTASVRQRTTGSVGGAKNPNGEKCKPMHDPPPVRALSDVGKQDVHLGTANGGLRDPNPPPASPKPPPLPFPLPLAPLPPHAWYHDVLQSLCPSLLARVIAIVDSGSCTFLYAAKTQTGAN